MVKWDKVTVMQILMSFRMLFGRICCRALKNIVVVEDRLKIGDEKESELVSSDSSFEVDTDDKFEGKNSVWNKR